MRTVKQETGLHTLAIGTADNVGTDLSDHDVQVMEPMM